MQISYRSFELASSKKRLFFFIKQQANNNDHGHKKSADKICNKHLAVVRMAR